MKNEEKSNFWQSVESRLRQEAVIKDEFPPFLHNRIMASVREESELNAQPKWAIFSSLRIALAGGIAATCSLQSINETLPIAIFTIFWISGFDILYALQDFKHDVKSGIYSVPSYFGKKKAIILSSICFVTASSSIFYYLHSNNSHGSTYILLILLVLGFFIQIGRKRHKRNLKIKIFLQLKT